MMKNLQTKPTHRLLLGLTLAVTVISLQRAAFAGGTDILHFMSKTTMTNTDVDLDARGTVDANLTRQGHAYNQQLKIAVANLDPDTVYQLAAFLGNDTNVTDVAQFTTDANGAFKIALLQKSQGKQSPKLEPLPPELDPLCNVRELAVLNGNTQAVLRATLISSPKGQYMVKRSLNNPGFLPAAAGDLRIKSNFQSTQFRLATSHLTPNTDYVLWLNGNAAQTNTSDSKGSLSLKVLPPGSPSVYEIHTIEWTDTATNVVLTIDELGLPCGSAVNQSNSAN